MPGVKKGEQRRMGLSSETVEALRITGALFNLTIFLTSLNKL